MTVRPIGTLPAGALTAPDEATGFGILRTAQGALPLHRLDVRAKITGLAAAVDVEQGFRNPYDRPLEATYVFPLPPRAALTRLTLTAGDRVVQAELQERGAARQNYDAAIAAGQRAAIAEEERPDVFTLRVGNIAPGERVTVALTLAQPLALVDGQAEFRFPLVVAPRYIPGRAIGGEQVGDGHAADTDAVPDASRISPPVLLPGFPNPVALSLRAEIDPAGLTLTGVDSSLHAVTDADGVIEIRPGERLDRDFILRLSFSDGSDALLLAPDADGAGGTFQLLAFPPADSQARRPRDVVLLLDRSGSMGGWKMVAARRAAARIVDTLLDADRFAVLAFDDRIEHPEGLPAGLVPASDRHRYRAVEHLARMEARGGTELLAPLRDGLALLDDSQRDRVLVLVTDGQVGNEDHILREVAGALGGVRVHTVGIDQAVNAGFLGRLASAGHGRCELVESEDRLDAAMERIHRRIGAPAVTGLRLDGTGVTPGSVTGLGDLFPGVPLVVAGRYQGEPAGLALRGRTADDGQWSSAPAPRRVAGDAVTPCWARAYLRDLEDRYTVTRDPQLEQAITAASLRFGVLCRFTAYVAVDTRVVTDGSAPHRVTQPVEQPAGWQPAPVGAPPPLLSPMAYPLSASSPFPGAPAAAPPPAPGRAAPFRAKLAGLARSTPPEPTGTASWIDSELPIGGGYIDAERSLARVTVLPVLAEEHRALTAAAQAPLRQRRELLDDLASRLDALAHDPGSGQHAATLADLVRLLRDESVPFETRWARAVEVLADLAGRAGGTGPTRGAGGDDPSGAPRRSDFWR
jgi:Ca-activated chloride channel family protein